MSIGLAATVMGYRSSLLAPGGITPVSEGGTGSNTLGTSNNILTGNGTSPITATLATMAVNGNALTFGGGSTLSDSGSGQLSMGASGTNQSFKIFTTGSGRIFNEASTVIGATVDTSTSVLAFTTQTTNSASTASPTNNYGTLIQTTGSQTSAADFYGLIVNDTGTFGSGTHYLFDARLSGTSKGHIDASGNISMAGSLNGTQVAIGAGSASTPSVVETGTSTGLYFTATPAIGFTVAGSSVGTWTATGLTAAQNLSVNGNFFAQSSATVAFGLTAGNIAYSYGNAIVNGYTAFGTTPQTYTLTGTVSPANFQATYFGIPNFTNASVSTITNLATVTIAGAPTVAGSQAATNFWALQVLAGNVNIAATTASTNLTTGALVVGGGVGVAGTVTASNIISGNVVQGATLVLSGKVTNYNNVLTAGIGVVPVVSAPRSTAVTNATASLTAYTVPAADSSFKVSANVLVTATTAAAMTVTCTYTDEGNTSRTFTLGFTQLAGATVISSITNVTGTGPYVGLTYHIRAKASSTITFATTGTVTGITYNVEGSVIQTS